MFFRAMNVMTDAALRRKLFNFYRQEAGRQRHGQQQSEEQEPVTAPLRTPDQQWVLDMYKNCTVFNQNWNPNRGDVDVVVRRLPNLKTLQGVCERVKIATSKPVENPRGRRKADGVMSAPKTTKDLTRKELANALFRWLFERDQLGRLECWTPINERPITDGDIRKLLPRILFPEDYASQGHEGDEDQGGGNEEYDDQGGGIGGDEEYDDQGGGIGGNDEYDDQGGGIGGNEDVVDEQTEEEEDYSAGEEGDTQVRHDPVADRIEFVEQQAQSMVEWELLWRELRNTLDDRIVRGAHKAVWASALAPDQKWERGNWTQVDGEWEPPGYLEDPDPSNPEAERLVQEATTGRPSKLAKASMHLHYFSRFFGSEELQLLVAQSNKRLAQLRDGRQRYYRDAAGVRHLRPPPPNSVTARDSSGEWIEPQVSAMEVLQFIGMHLCAASRSHGRRGHPVPWILQGDRPILAINGALDILHPSRFRFLNAVIASDCPEGDDLMSHGDRLRASGLQTEACEADIRQHSGTWRFGSLLDSFNEKCLRHAPRVYRASYDEARWGFTGRLPKGMKKAGRNKKGGSGVDHMMLCSAEKDTFGYRIVGEIDFGHSWRARSDPLCRQDGPLNQRIVPRAERILRLVKASRANTWCHVFADNAFTLLSTMRRLFDEKVFYTGTTQRKEKRYGLPHALVRAPLRTRGSFVGFTDVYDVGSQASCWAWADKGDKATMAMSSFFEVSDSVQISRRSGPARIDIPAPKALHAYNAHMGGVDVNSQLAHGSMTCRQKTSHWTVSIFYSLLDQMRTNAFILNRRDFARRERTGPLGRLDARSGAALLGGLLSGLICGTDGRECVKRTYGLGQVRTSTPAGQPRATPSRAEEASPLPLTRRVPQVHARAREHVRYGKEEIMNIPVLEEFPFQGKTRVFEITGEKTYHKNCDMSGQLHGNRRAARYYCTMAGMSFCSPGCYNRWLGADALTPDEKRQKREQDLGYLDALGDTQVGGNSATLSESESSPNTNGT